MSYSHAKRASFARRVRDTVRKNSTGRSNSRGRSLSVRFGNWWKPKHDKTSKIILVPGDYVGFDGESSEWFEYIQHWVVRSNKSLLCSKQYKRVDGKLAPSGGKCLACDERDANYELNNDSGGISFSSKSVFNIIHLAYYHLVPVIGRDGKEMSYERDGKKIPIYDKIECEGRRCKYCKDGYEKTFGKHVHWSLGPRHFQQLSGYVDEISRDCACGGRGTIETYAYKCPECGKLILDYDKTDMPDEEFDEFGYAEVKCKSCKKTVLPEPVISCSECDEPEPLSIFDCTLDVKLSGSGTDTTVQVVRWSVSDEPNEVYDLASNPFDFADVFAGDPFDIQAKVLKVRNPYGKDADEDEAEEYEDDVDYED